MRPLVKGLAAAAVLSAACGSAHAQQNVTLKMQATWPASLTLYENFLFFADRVTLQKWSEEEEEDEPGPVELLEPRTLKK